MGRYRVCVIAAWLLICMAWVQPNLSVEAQAARPLLVLVSVATGGDDIGLGTLRQVFSGYMTQHNNTRLIPFNQGVGSPARLQFDRAVMGLAPDQVGAYWIDRRIRQGTEPPRSIASAELLLRVVASLRGAIGYVEMNPSEVPAGLIMLTIEGKKPADHAYPLLAH